MVRVVLLGLVAGLVVAAGASARVVDVPTLVESRIPKAHDAGVVVLLPSTMNLDDKSAGKIYADASASRAKASYEITLSSASGCGKSTACFLASFTGARGARLGYKATNVKLALGMAGYYDAGGCGGSCSPPSIQWIQKGVRYEIQANAPGGRKAFVAMANSAILHGNRK